MRDEGERSIQRGQKVEFCVCVCVCVILPPDVSPSRPHDVCTCMQVSSASDVPATVVVWRKPLSAHTNKKKETQKVEGVRVLF